MAKNKKKKGNKAPFIIFGIFSFLVLLILVGAYAIINHIYNKTTVDYRNENYTIAATTENWSEDVTGDITEVSSEDTPEDELDEYKKAAQEAAAQLGLDKIETKDVYNILLIGSDTREVGEDGRSDTMMLVSINNSTKQIVCTSFLRDLYVYIPKRECWDKLNSAFAYGGVELLFDTLEYNFSIQIDQYIMVDFYSYVKVVDMLGGIDVDVKEEELYWCNQYIHASNLLLGEEEDSDYLTYADGSFQHLSGKQVLAYSRFRYVGNADFSRTERQRKVMNIIFEKIKTVRAADIFKLIDAIAEEVTHDIPKNEFIELIELLPEMSKYKVISWGIPDQDFKYITVNGQSSIGIDFTYYIKKLYGLIYTEKTLEDYKK